MSDQVEPLLQRSVAARSFLWLLALCLRRVHGDEGGLAVINCLDKGMEAFQLTAAANEWGMSEADQFDIHQMARVLRMMWDEDDPEPIE